MSKSSSSSSSGIGFAGLLTIAFIVLKLTHYIDWSWWWVLSPSLISIGLVLIILACVGLWTWIKVEKKQKELDPYKGRESKFMQKLIERMRESEERKGSN